MMHEASLHEDNCFVTLTYDAEHLPADMSLDVRHWQLFAKRLRKRVGPFRFFHCGEYGENFARPHYHAIIFGYDFPDKVYFKGDGETKVYTSDLLDSLWQLGHSLIGAVTFESAAYVARYVTKKVTGEAAHDHYFRVSDVDGSLVPVSPEYSTMSRRPGIAADWFRKFGNEVYPSDEIISRGFSSRPPRYYDNLLEVTDSTVFDMVKRKRIVRARELLSVHDRDGVALNAGTARLKARERVARAKLSLSKRPIG